MQRRYIDYQKSLSSFEKNLSNLGLLIPGRYVGFDTLIPDPQNPLAFSLGHSKTGISYMGLTAEIVGPCGVLLTPQFTTISEDTPISGLVIEGNSGNPFSRFDLVVCTHEYKSISGGEAATYSVIKGPLNSPIKPLLSDIRRQVLVGTIEVPPGVSNIPACIWHKSKCPDTGDGEDARLGDVNLYQALQGEKKSSSIDFPPTVTDTHTSGAHIAKLWTLDNDGNTFVIPTSPVVVVNEAERFSVDPYANNSIDAIRVRNIPLHEGIRIHLMIDSSISLRESRLWENSATLLGSGYRGLKINPGLGNYTLPANQVSGGITGYIRPNEGEIWDVELVLIDGLWQVAQIGGAGSKNPFIKGMTIMWKGDISTNFDETGLGINLMMGWQILNGNKGTDDARGRHITMASGVPAAGQSINPLTETNLVSLGQDPQNWILGNPYEKAGTRKILLAKEHLPAYELDVEDPGHTHIYNTKSNTKSCAPGGGQENRWGGDRNENTGNSKTNIKVYSGGGGTAYDYTAPYYMTVLIMKL